MAEQLIAAITADTDNNGQPDFLDKLMSHSAFGAGKDNWRNRRMLVIASASICFLIPAVLTAVWFYMAAKRMPLDPNLAAVAQTLIGGALFTGVSLVSMYCGVVVADQSGMRNALSKVTATLSANMPPPSVSTTATVIDTTVQQPSTQRSPTNGVGINDVL